MHEEHDADTFNPTAQPSRLRGGRFDSLDGSYAYTYLGYDDEGAIAETVARDLPLDGSARLVPRVRIKGRRITTVEVMRSLAVLSLHGPWVAQVGAGLWLTKSDADQYEQTRAWAAWLLETLSSVDGFAYRCRHDEDRMALALFDDTPGGGTGRAAGALRAHPDTEWIDRGEGLLEVERILGRHNAAVEPH
ncbi:RES family NAD+ phosphorylase [Nocardioides endophyticus]|uniref:RES family NAD+ phosphorylase n=1 Tax=Nocardioides endophyticus TaxID=1353775 RepID=UPI0031E7E30D